MGKSKEERLREKYIKADADKTRLLMVHNLLCILEDMPKPIVARVISNKLKMEYLLGVGKAAAHFKKYKLLGQVERIRLMLEKEYARHLECYLGINKKHGKK